MSSPIAQAMKDICEEKGIAYESVLETIEAALAAAYRKDFGEINQNVKVKFDPETAAIQAFDEKEVVTDEFVAEALKEIEERRAQRELEMQLRAEGKLPPTPVPPPPVAPTEPQLNPDGTPVVEAPKYNPKLHLALTEAQTHEPNAKVGETITISLPVPGAFGRMAAQTAKQVVMQRLREAERDTIYNQWKGREGELILGTIHRREARVVLVDLGARANGILREEEQIPTDRYVPGARYKFILYGVGKSLRGPELLVSRTHPDLVRKLFSMEVPEVASGAVEIRSVAREPGSRAKVSVISTEENVDPIGACIGQRGTRVQTVIAELGGEKIDIIPHSDDPKVFIANAMAPAKVTHVLLDEANRLAVVLVAPEQFSLAIGRGGQNVRLAARLTGWRISVQEARPEGAPPAPAIENPEATASPTEETSMLTDDAKNDGTETLVAPSPDAPESPVSPDAPAPNS
ncbi:transcription termination/antitermination protein NusA [Candidatus Uhrbacteria bacterium]|nr:transcription termination/antitermination protein NusA [Candidatus Uhrbacteria bacterium]